MRRLGVKHIAGLGVVHSVSNITAFELFSTMKVSLWFSIGLSV
jgi:hypothetical protein